LPPCLLRPMTVGTNIKKEFQAQVFNIHLRY